MHIWFGSGKSIPPDFCSNNFAAEAGANLKKVVLVVDDEPLIADTISAVLTEHGFAAYGCYSGEEAVRLALTLRPNIVLSDVLMPNMSGVEMAIDIKNHLPETRIVLLSGHAATAGLLRQAAVDGHRFELLAKPIHPEELIEMLKRNSG
ncbi:MAG TPA: response regulator [Acidobacteriaceae bacterium]|jgi:CheY-like chemotaxis protein|nr:response regulator [Acidobacteriaceae bacterium]